jgi:glycosyltransferase involved in cell wall biosynthesis
MPSRSTHFTVIIPVFNGEDYLREAIYSVLDAALEHKVEVIVVDDGSTDSTPTILREFGARISLITQKNSGEAQAVNTGLSICSGEIVMVLSADDRLVGPEAFEGVRELFLNQRNLAAAFANWRVIDNQGNRLREVFLPEYSHQEFIGASRCIPGPGTFFRRSLGESIGGRNPKWKYVSDFDFWLRLADRGNFVSRQVFAAEWRTHENSTSVSQVNLRMFEETHQVMSDFLRNHPQSGSLEKRALANAYINSAILMVRNPTLPGRRYLLKALRSSLKTTLIERFGDFVLVAGLPFTEMLLKKRDRQ